MGLADRARGVLIGGAVGDALGAPVEFEPAARIVGRRQDLFELPGGGIFDWAPGEFTDDTQMAIVLARHLGSHGTVMQPELAREFANWAGGAKDVGSQTRAVLSAVASGASWRAGVALLPPTAAGNGSLMRVAPVALAARSREQAVALARAQSEITHPNEVCLDACGVFAALLWSALETGVADYAGALDVAATVPVEQCILRSEADAPAPKVSGWVLHTLTGALWAVRGADCYADAIWRAVCLGEDADTVAAVAGALAGALWGASSIPKACAGALTSEHPAFAAKYPDALVELADGLIRARAPRPVLSLLRASWRASARRSSGR
jgi:ADP-ribosylglycohydrolase